MAVWTCNDFEGHWPVGAAAVVIAPTKDRAEVLLSAELARQGLKPTGFTILPLDTHSEKAVVLVNGDY